MRNLKPGKAVQVKGRVVEDRYGCVSVQLEDGFGLVVVNVARENIVR